MSGLIEWHDKIKATVEATLDGAALADWTEAVNGTLASLAASEDGEVKALIIGASTDLLRSSLLARLGIDTTEESFPSMGLLYTAIEVAQARKFNLDDHTQLAKDASTWYDTLPEDHQYKIAERAAQEAREFLRRPVESPVQ